ncbi:MAG: hypothetical protein SNH27_10310, partial [Rikenellaceae bacterium]
MINFPYLQILSIPINSYFEFITHHEVLESLSLSAHPVKAKSTNTMKRKSYDSAFKQRAIKLSENLG